MKPKIEKEKEIKSETPRKLSGWVTPSLAKPSRDPFDGQRRPLVRRSCHRPTTCERDHIVRLQQDNAISSIRHLITLIPLRVRLTLTSALHTLNIGHPDELGAIRSPWQTRTAPTSVQFARCVDAPGEPAGLGLQGAGGVPSITNHRRQVDLGSRQSSSFLLHLRRGRRGRGDRRGHGCCGRSGGSGGSSSGGGSDHGRPSVGSYDTEDIFPDVKRRPDTELSQSSASKINRSKN
jgi:hypothetical protein